MPKFYKNLKTGAIISEAEFKEKLMSNVTEVGSDFGMMGMGSGAYSNFGNEIFEGEIDNYSEYVPYDPDQEE
ncbi:hypothetical protein [Enterococcus sp. 5H]|uniref:hypothetical protein n=1 Tax=Enterococcus sp. 5H TaxID=1229490 RepID=UPI0023029613|nr:hypothetical protein [Enterococcus sp. 5H]MDA9470620.1 hypothetical protein [Enterococcus sp. 5H]